MNYTLPKNLMIKSLDKKNWAVIKTSIAEEGKNEGEEVESVVGYFPDLKACARGALKILSLSCIENEELVKALDQYDSILDKISKITI